LLEKSRSISDFYQREQKVQNAFGKKIFCHLFMVAKFWFLKLVAIPPIECEFYRNFYDAQRGVSAE